MRTQKHEIASFFMRRAGGMVQNTLRKHVLQPQSKRGTPHRTIKDRPVVRTLAIYGASKFAARTVPGAMLIGGALLTKSLYDHIHSTKQASGHGDELADETSEK